MPNNVDAFPAIGFLRLPSVLAPKGPIPVSKSTWWAGVKTGRYPNPPDRAGTTLPQRVKKSLLITAFFNTTGALLP